MQNQLTRLSGALPRTARRTAALAAMAALALPASALAAGFSIKLHAPNHAPVVGKRWPIELTISKGHQKLSGSVRYEFLFAKTVVSTEPKTGAFKFTHGVYRDNLVFPTQALGEVLTLRFVVRTKYGTKHIDWVIRARKSA